MDHPHCVECTNFAKESKKGGRGPHVEKLPIDVNGEKFRQNFKGYLKNVNQAFIHSRHDVFSSFNWSNLERVLSDYGTSDVVKAFSARLACARSFRLELTESYKMHKEEQYMESTLERESHLRHRKLKQRHYEQMGKQMFARNQREYRDFERKEQQKARQEGKRKMQGVVKSIIHAAFKVAQMGTTYGDSFFYDALFSLEKSFFMRKIKNMSELAQNNARVNELAVAGTPMGVFEKGEKKQKKGERKEEQKEVKKEENEQKMAGKTTKGRPTEGLPRGPPNQLNLLRCQGTVDCLFRLDLRNVSAGKGNGTEKRAYMHMLAYLANQGELSGVNRKELHSEHPDIRYGRRYSDYKEKLLEGLSQIDMNYVKERMGDKHFSTFPMDVVEEKVKELPLLKSLLLTLFKKGPRENHPRGKYTLPLKIAITGKIKKDAKRLAEHLRRKFPLKVYDVDEIEEDVRRVCSGGSSHDAAPRLETSTDAQKTKRRIARKIKRIAQTLEQKNYEEKNRDSLYADLLYYLIKHDYDLFHVSRRGGKSKGLKEVSPNEEAKGSKRNKYRGYIIVNFFYSLKQYALFELKVKKRFIFNGFSHEHLRNLERGVVPPGDNTPHKNKAENQEGKGDPKLGVNKHGGNKKRSGKTDAAVRPLPDDGDAHREEEVTTELQTSEMEKKNILFFSNFICNIEDWNCVKGRHHFSGATDVHFHVERSNREMNRILFRRITRGELSTGGGREEDRDSHTEGDLSPKRSDDVFIKLKRVNPASVLKRRSESDTELRIPQGCKRKKRHTMKCRMVGAKGVPKMTPKEVPKKTPKTGQHGKDPRCTSPDEQKFRPNLHLMRRIFQMDRSCQEVEAFLRENEGGATYPRFHLLGRHPCRSASLLVSRVLRSGRGRSGGEVASPGGGIGEKEAKMEGEKDAKVEGKKDAKVEGKKDAKVEGKKDAKVEGEKDSKMENNCAAKRDPHPGGNPLPRRVDSRTATYFKLRYCHIVKGYISHLFNLFMWRENLKKNVKQTVEEVHRNMHIFTEEVEIEPINEIVQSYNRLRTSGIRNKKVELVLCKEMNSIMLKIWLRILKGKKDSTQKQKMYIPKWMDKQMSLLIFFAFYSISIEHELYVKLAHFVNELICCLLNQEDGSASKNEKEKHLLIFHYFPKSKKDFYSFEGGNYHFPFLQNVREDVRKFLTEHLDGRSSSKSRSDDSNGHDSPFHREREKDLLLLAKEFHFLSSCRFVHKFNCLLNDTVATLREYLFIFHDLNNCINDFISLHYFAIYKRVNLTCVNVKRAIQSERPIRFSCTGGMRKGNTPGNATVNNAHKPAGRRKKKKGNIANEEHPFFNRTEMKQSFRRSMTFTFLKNVMSHILVGHHSVVISRGDLQNAITQSLLLVKDKTEQVTISNWIGGTLLDAYFEERSVSPEHFLQNSRTNDHNDSPCVFPNTEGKQNGYAFFPDFFFFLLFFFFKREGHPTCAHKIFPNYLNVLEQKLASTGELSGGELLQVLRGCLSFWASLADGGSPLGGGAQAERGDEQSGEKCNSEDAAHFFSRNTANPAASENCAERNHLNKTKKKKNCEESIDHFTFAQFAALGLFDFADTRKKLKKEETQKRSYETYLLNKFVFNCLFSLSLFPNFYEHVQIYVKNYLLKKNAEVVSSFEKCVMEKMKSAEGRAGDVALVSPAQPKGEGLNGLRRGQDHSATLFNTKKKVRVREILIFFHTSYPCGC
ncbi:conserved Plasmodium protein, unknown function [Plasmodium vivax]|uniref:Uncharacterized protein n=1 Tax=Plasmodium vivax TaxID=5855 RepID=A0A1G4GWJ6_PLAVI|nr:conserved Plasmodium protein, unknown function [Plasmodium vivax]